MSQPFLLLIKVSLSLVKLVFPILQITMTLNTMNITFIP